MQLSAAKTKRIGISKCYDVEPCRCAEASVRQKGGYLYDIGYTNVFSAAETGARDTWAVADGRNLNSPVSDAGSSQRASLSVLVSAF